MRCSRLSRRNVGMRGDARRPGGRLHRAHVQALNYCRPHGWPWYDGQIWYFPAPVFDPDRWAAFLNSQPAEEPFTLMPARKGTG